MALFTKKEPYQYKIMERYRIDIKKTNQVYMEGKSKLESWNGRDFCHIIARGEKYVFYGYRTHEDGSGGYVLRQNVDNPRNIVFFGNCKIFNCVFHNYLFQVDRGGELGRFGITARNVDTGAQFQYNWLSERANYFTINGYGRFYCQDTVKDVYVKNDKLIFHISRKKSSDPHHKYPQVDRYDIDVEYDLVVEYVSGRFRATAIFPTDEVNTTKCEDGTTSSKPLHQAAPAPQHISSLFSICDEHIGQYVQVIGKYFWIYTEKDPYRCNLVEYGPRGDARILVELAEPLPEYITTAKATERYPIIIHGILEKEKSVLSEYTLKQGVYHGYWRDESGNVVCDPKRCNHECTVDCPIFANQKGEDQSLLRNYSDARELFQKAVQTASDYWLPWRNLGYIYLREENYTDAFESLHIANNLLPNDEKCLYGLVISLAKIKRLKEAEDYLSKYENLYPTRLGAELRRIVLDCQDRKETLTRLTDAQYVELYNKDYDAFWNRILQEKESAFATTPCRYEGAFYRTRCEHLKAMTRLITHGNGEELLRMKNILVRDGIPNAAEMCIFDIIDEYERRYIKY